MTFLTQMPDLQFLGFAMLIGGVLGLLLSEAFYRLITKATNTKQFEPKLKYSTRVHVKSNNRNHFKYEKD